jgi:hypothetical protein
MGSCMEAVLLFDLTGEKSLKSHIDGYRSLARILEKEPKIE